MLITKRELMSFEGLYDDYIYSNWFYGGDISLLFEGEGDKTIYIYGYDEKEQRLTYIDNTSIAEGVETVVFSITNVAYSSLTIRVRNTVSDFDVLLTIENEYDVLVNQESVSTTPILINTSVLYDLMAFENRNITIRFLNEKTEITQSLICNNLYLDGDEYQLTALSDFSRYDNNRKQASFSVMKVVNV